MGGTVWIGWSWFFCLWKEADNGCSACMWFGVDGVSVLYAKYGYSNFGRFGVDCDSIFCSFLSDGVEFMESAVLPKQCTGTSIDSSFAKPGGESFKQSLERKKSLAKLR